MEGDAFIRIEADIYDIGLLLFWGISVYVVYIIAKYCSKEKE